MFVNVRMNLVYSLIRTVLSIHLLLSSSQPFIIDPECPPTPQNPIRIQNERSHAHLPPADSMALSLEYFDRTKDLKNFRRTSKHFEEIYQLYKEHQAEKFQALHLLFTDSHRECKRYHSFEELLKTVPCIPGVYFDVNSNQSIESLSRMQFNSNRRIVRGVTKHQKQPFLSLSMWTDRQPLNTLFLICIFNLDGSANVRLIKYLHSIRESKKWWEYHEVWTIGDLIGVLNEKRWTYSGLQNWERGTWHLGKRPKLPCTECPGGLDYTTLVSNSHRERRERHQYTYVDVIISLSIVVFLCFWSIFGVIALIGR